MKILVIQQKMIGDVLTSSMLFSLLSDKFPDAKLHYVVNSNTKAVVENHRFIHEIHEITPEIASSAAKLLQFAWFIRKQKFDVVIDVYSKLSSNIITLLSGAGMKISKFKWYTSWLYTHPVKYHTVSNMNLGLAIENRLQLLEPLNITIGSAKPEIYLTSEELTAAKTKLEKAGFNFSHPIFMISVLGSGPNKTYPANYMAHVLDTIVATDPTSQVLFNYIPKQKEQALIIFNACNTATQEAIFFDIYGSNLREFLALTKLSTALIGNEGGAINMAKALDIPTFAIFSPWIDKATWNLFEDDQKHVSVHLQEFWPEHYEGMSNKALKPKADYYYKLFKPELFQDQLITFLKQFEA